MVIYLKYELGTSGHREENITMRKTSKSAEIHQNDILVDIRGKVCLDKQQN
jgi:hypothetical protein